MPDFEYEFMVPTEATLTLSLYSILSDERANQLSKIEKNKLHPKTTTKGKMWSEANLGGQDKEMSQFGYHVENIEGSDGKESDRARSRCRTYNFQMGLLNSMEATRTLRFLSLREDNGV